VDLFVCIVFKMFYIVIHMFKIYYSLTNLLSCMIFGLNKNKIQHNKIKYNTIYQIRGKVSC